MTNRRPTPDSSGQRSALDWAEQAGLGDALVAELAARAGRRRARTPATGAPGWHRRGVARRRDPEPRLWRRTAVRDLGARRSSFSSRERACTALRRDGRRDQGACGRHRIRGAGQSLRRRSLGDGGLRGGRGNVARARGRIRRWAEPGHHGRCRSAGGRLRRPFRRNWARPGPSCHAARRGRHRESARLARDARRVFRSTARGGDRAAQPAQRRATDARRSLACQSADQRPRPCRQLRSARAPAGGQPRRHSRAGPRSWHGVEAALAA